MASSSPLAPTFYGHITSTQDALLLFEACLSGALNHVARRPHDRERPNLIKSGNVFIYEEHSSGIKRWTDGVPWSPSRILGNFLVYRELERPFPPGEKKRAMKRGKRSSPGISKQEIVGGGGNGIGSGYNTAAASPTFESSSSLSKETERSLIGSLVDSYGFKEQGLVKKTVSVTVGGVSHHLVSYYTVADVMNNKLMAPSKDPRFQHIIPRPDLVTKQNFRTPIDEVDSLDRMDDRPIYPSYSYPRSSFDVASQSVSHRSMSLPTPPLSYQPASSNYPNYTNRVPTQYDARGQSQSGSLFNSPYSPPPGAYPAHRTESYDPGDYRQQRCDSTAGVGLESSRSQSHPVVNTDFARRPSNFEQNNSIDSCVSEMSSTSTDSKFTNDSGYSSQCYDGIRDIINTPQPYPPQRSLPTPTQHSYERHAVQPYGGVDESSLKRENFWVMGNTGPGHGHYIAPQQQWTSGDTL